MPLDCDWERTVGPGMLGGGGGGGGPKAGIVPFCTEMKGPAFARSAPTNAAHRAIDATAQALHEGGNLTSLVINLFNLPMDCPSGDRHARMLSLDRDATSFHQLNHKPPTWKCYAPSGEVNAINGMLDRDTVHTPYCCHRTRVRSIAFPLRNCRHWTGLPLLHRRHWTSALC
jgi:hypothetical protein